MSSTRTLHALLGDKKEVKIGNITVRKMSNEQFLVEKSGQAITKETLGTQEVSYSRPLPVSKRK